MQKICYESIILGLCRYSSIECTGRTWPFELPGVTDTCEETYGSLDFEVCALCKMYTIAQKKTSYWIWYNLTLNLVYVV